MNNRYSKYFLQNVLHLQDPFCDYFAQNPLWGPTEIIDVEHILFFYEEDARQWLEQCVDYDRWWTFYELRTFLAESLEPYPRLNRMSDAHVMRAAASLLCLYSYRIVIRPKHGFAVNVDTQSAGARLPISVGEKPDIDAMLADLKTQLDALVAEQQKKHHRIDAELANMTDAEKAAFYGKKAGSGSWQSLAGDTWEMIKSLPGFYVGYLKFMGKVITTPARMGVAVSQSIMTGTNNPFKEEIDKIVGPVARTYDEAVQLKSMLTILLSEPQVYDMLWDFAQRYYDATHPAELTEMGAAAVTDVLVTVLLACITAGTGAAANIAAKAPRLVKIFKLLEKITATIRRMNPAEMLTAKSIEALQKTARAAKRKIRPRARGMPEVKRPKKDVKPTEKLDNNGKKRDGGADKKDEIGPKTTPKITGDKGTTVNVDGHKIYDPSHTPLSSNPKAQYRFSDPSYRSTGGDVYFGENVGTAFHEVRKNVHGKSLYVGEARVDNILDLSDPDVVKQMNIDPAKLTARVDDVVAQKKVYGYTNQIANQAYDAGYSGIVYPSSRKAGSNAVVLFEGRYDPKAIKPILDMSIP